MTDGATQLQPDEFIHLIPSHIKTRGQLNVAEALAIEEALEKFQARRLSVAHVLDDLFIRRLHGEMFKGVWTWAGKYRQVNLNLGVDFRKVAEEVRDLVDDAKVWLRANSEAELEMSACRLHHRLVSIHPFVNGNGRHARAYTDILLTSAGLQPFSWEIEDLSMSETRKRYIGALKKADLGDFAELYELLTSRSEAKN